MPRPAAAGRSDASCCDDDELTCEVSSPFYWERSKETYRPAEVAEQVDRSESGQGCCEKHGPVHVRFGKVVARGFAKKVAAEFVHDEDDRRDLNKELNECRER